MGAKHEKIIYQKLFYIFVDFGTEFDAVPICWIIPNKIVVDVLTKSHQMYLIQPVKNGKERKDKNIRLLLPGYKKIGWNEYGFGWLDQYKECWKQIIGASESNV